MGYYIVFQRNEQDRRALKDSGYPWVALLFAPFWALGKRLFLHGVVLSVLFGLCAILIVAANNGIVVGAAIALWLGVFSAHNATDWLASSLEKRGYRITARVEADSGKAAAHRSRGVKLHRVLLANVSSKQLSEMLARSETAR